MPLSEKSKIETSPASYTSSPLTTDNANKGSIIGTRIEELEGRCLDNLMTVERIIETVKQKFFEENLEGDQEKPIVGLNYPDRLDGVNYTIIRIGKLLNTLEDKVNQL